MRVSRCSYDLTVQFLRATGDGPILLNVPTGSSTTQVVLDAKGGYYGLLTIGDNALRENATTLRLGAFENGRPHTVAVKVGLDGNQVAVRTVMDGRTLFNWKGPQSALSASGPIALPNRKTLGHCTYGSPVIFRSVRLRMHSGRMKRLRS